MGAAKARNTGLKQTSGKYIAYLDSDNVWHNRFLEVMVENIDDNQMIYCSQNLLFCDNENGKNKIIARKTHNAPYNPVALLKENYIDINAVLHTRTILDKIGYFDESLGTSEDWDLFARIAIAYPFRIKHIDQVLCDYYYYTDKVLTTITNTNHKNSSLRTFGLENKHKDTLYLYKKFQLIVKQTYK
jgi:glycosyltransferase involved in cell wall biosynthesis